MTLFLDASVIVAIVAEEEDAKLHLRRLASDRERLTSPVACWEAIVAVARQKKQPITAIRPAVDNFFRDAGVRMVSLGDKELDGALDALIRYGKNNHPARLNMGDCFAYACAKSNNARLLYKGDDFAKTDLAWPADA